MIHECLVVDNSNFFKDGTIRVRIKSFVLDPMSLRDMSTDPADSINIRGGQRYDVYPNGEKEFKYDDEDVLITTPIGGSFDYGIFMLPQPNTWGVVGDLGSMNIDGGRCKYIWLGALPKYNEQTKTISIPSDKIEEKNGCNEGQINIDNPNASFIFKQKDTKISESSEKINQEESQKTLNWKERPLYNMVVIDKDKIWIVHNDENEDGKQIGQSQLLINQEGINLNYKNEESSTTSNFSMNKDGSFDLKNENLENNIINTLSADDSSITLSHTDNDTNSGLFMGKDHNGDPALSLNFKRKNDKIATEVIMNSSGMTINSGGNISINPGQNGDITLGTGGGYIVTSQAPGTFSVDNHVFTAVKSAKA